LKSINVVVSPQGESKIETTGFAGAECREASRGFEHALGVATAEQLTADFYAPAVEQSQLREGA
jgi:hypothetical protein